MGVASQLGGHHLIFAVKRVHAGEYRTPEELGDVVDLAPLVEAEPETG